MIARTPEPPYWAVIFTSLRTDVDDGYDRMAEAMAALAAQQPGFLGVESAREGLGVTVSYWADLESIAAWKAVLKHQAAQRAGRERWYADYTTRIARVERDYTKASSELV
ncbi:MAG TPA: antibiotic biosynthesis monooxygenase [Gemmatimonadales bacterium]|nr:antibiotic biosynthesis monooxygenase [Gemmatimonadales bacterium]